MRDSENRSASHGLRAAALGWLVLIGMVAAVLVAGYYLQP